MAARPGSVGPSRREAPAVPPGALGILGGTFDPIHLGHLALAREARAAFDLVRVLLVPNADPPHKGDQVTPAEHRAAMVALAVADDEGLVLSRIELERPGPSYAVDTVASVAVTSRSEGRPEPWFILSAETLLDLPAWREPERIAALARIAVGCRAGTPQPDQAWLTARFPGLEERFTFLAGPQVDIAATDVRERIGDGSPIDGLVPEAVAQYIREHGLYAPSLTLPSSEDAGARPIRRAKMEANARPVEEPVPVNGEQDSIDVASIEGPPGDADEDPTPTAVADPRRSPRPGLPSSRRERTAAAPSATDLVVEADPAVLRLAHRVVDLAADKKASDIVLLDVRGQTTMTDYFVICSGASDRQIGAIADGIVEGARDEGERPLSREGEASSHWILVDFGGVIVHVMSVPEREFYQLEKLWSRGALLLHIV